MAPRVLALRALALLLLVAAPTLYGLRELPRAVAYLTGERAGVTVVDVVPTRCGRSSARCLQPVVVVPAAGGPVRVQLRTPTAGRREPEELLGRRLDVRWPTDRPSEAAVGSEVASYLGFAVMLSVAPSLVLLSVVRAQRPGAPRRRRPSRPESGARRARREAAAAAQLDRPLEGPARERRSEQLAALAAAARAVGTAPWLDLADRADALRDTPFTPRELVALRAGMPPTTTSAGSARSSDSGHVPTHEEQALVPLLQQAHAAGQDLVSRLEQRERRPRARLSP